MRLFHSALFCSAALCCIAFCACTPARVERPLVLVTVAPQGWLVEALAADWVDVHVLVPQGAHPASYAPGQGSMQKVSQADVYLTLGAAHFPFERTWVERILDLNPDLRVVPAAKADPREDPHLWTGFEGTRRLTEVAYRALRDLLPQQHAGLEANRTRVLERIASKEETFHRHLDGARGSRFYVFHPAWGALAREWDLEQVAIEEAGKEPSARHLAAVVARAQADSARFILAQPQFSQQGAEAVARAVGAKLVYVDPLQADWEAGMDDILAALDQALIRGGSE